jgi:prepilin peptidase CpaA
MNLLENLPLWLDGLLFILLGFAAIEDLHRLTISNWTSSAVLGAAVLALAISGWSPAIWQNVVLSCAILVLGALLFAAGKMGGGDVKLFAATVFWTNLRGALLLVPAILLAGGVLAVLVLSRRAVLRAAAGSKYVESKGVPYGVAIAVGTLLVLAFYMGRGHDRLQQLSSPPAWATKNNS